MTYELAMNSLRELIVIDTTTKTVRDVPANQANTVLTQERMHNHAHANARNRVEQERLERYWQANLATLYRRE